MHRSLLAWPLQQAKNLDGSLPFSLELLPAGHAPGLYEMKREFVRKVAPTSGTVVVTSSWDDVDDGAMALVSPALSLTSVGPLGLAANVLISSRGTAPLIYSGVFSGMSGAPDMSALGAVVLLHAFD